MLLRTALIAAALVVGVAAEPALARHGGRDAVQAGPVNVSRDQAHAIAQDHGVARIRESDLRGGVWKVEGWTAEGRAIEVRISATTGDVLEVEFYN
jgi:uncharacterized membrane protein YkoI